MLEEKIKGLPDKPGVYLMKNNEDKIIYVGKAISLKNRVKSYFVGKKHDSAKTRALVKNIEDLEYILTDSELEALILECNLIKKHRPKYNISLKDDKNYPYVKITNEDFPRILITRNKVKDGNKYFGPYTSTTSLKTTLEVIRSIFPYRSCNQKIFRNTRPCLNAHIKKCLAPCVGRISKEDYQQIIKGVILFLEGKQDTLLTKLHDEMEQKSENLEFEQAAIIRDQIKSIETIVEKQKIITNGQENQDVIAMARGFNTVCVQIFIIRSGKLIGRENFFLSGTDESSRGEVIASFIKQYYNEQDFIPKEIIIEEEIPEKEVIGQWLSEKRGARVYVKMPHKGERKDLLELVGKNALEVLKLEEERLLQKKSTTEEAIMELQKQLNLPELPLRIECFDISNTQGTESVASMVVFTEGRPDKSQYRKFKIKTVEGPNDFASIYEVIDRRFSNVQKEKKQITDKRFSNLPDLVIIDGGKGQLSEARKAMKKHGFDYIPTYGLAEKEELLFTENQKEPTFLPRNSQGLYLLQRLRDEAHRFAITYHRSLRGKRNLASILDDIPGVGEKRKISLLKHFGSFKKIQQANLEELSEVEGINYTVAESIYNYLSTHQDLLLRMKKSKE
ncbi:Excinuclease ABC subunit C [Desulfonispora thiosulfatigenes DSM 11270]|uniref:UvrABC system protein C n=1 Tax=Desulfonispora thiosulfatigenes DSM 11270 TaxID=656914 RepID=A0A1W1UWK1_DESTI|nr:excinuclease ABC subunit UvrC [Desulfonispora thiosulfatigenes]SMB85528.1 Excinuclease ABC subunit C [Desulfonispora thiosulfatigenes DSM 11270]